MKKIGVIGRFKPFHKGALALLETLCDIAEKVIIGIGSSNKYDLRNPFSAVETEAMIDRCLSKRFSNYVIVHIPDSGDMPEYVDGRKWVEDVKENFGELDLFVTGNPYVASLLRDEYNIINPKEIVPQTKYVKIKATLVRLKMAQGSGWRDCVSEEVADYLTEAGLVERFRNDFGAETLKVLANGVNMQETLEEEKLNLIGRSVNV